MLKINSTGYPEHTWCTVLLDGYMYAFEFHTNGYHTAIHTEHFPLDWPTPIRKDYFWG